MHVVHLSTRLDYYGGEVCLVNLANGMAQRGHRVSCLVRPGSALVRALAPGGAAVVEMPMLDWYDPATVQRVRSWLVRHEVDILATHLPRDYFIAAVGGWGLPLCNVATRHLLKPISWAFLKRPFLHGFGAVVAVSDAVADVVRRSRLVSAQRVVTVANGVAAPKPLHVQGLRQRVGVSASAEVVGFVGRLSPDKDPALLLRAVAQVVGRHPELQVFLVGDAEEGADYLPYLKGLVRDLGLTGHVHFFGHLPAAADYGRDFDVQVVPSRAEPCGLVTLEAMANGVPVVATAAGGSLEIVRDGVEGFLVPPGDPETMANRLMCLLESAGLRRQMGQQGAQRYRNLYTIERMVVETEKVYRQALAARA